MRMPHTGRRDRQKHVIRQSISVCSSKPVLVFSQDVFLQSQRRYVRMTRRNVSHAFSSNEFSRHNELLRRNVGLPGFGASVNSAR